LRLLGRFTPRSQTPSGNAVVGANRLFAPTVTIDEAVNLAAPVIRRYAKERLPGEGFGDFCERAILPKGRHLPQHRHPRGDDGTRRPRQRLTFFWSGNSCASAQLFSGKLIRMGRGQSMTVASVFFFSSFQGFSWQKPARE
jgi:hypothetical protein